MFSHLAKIALRVINRYKLYSFINIFGLAIGITAFISIVVFVKNELSFDQFHSKKDNIYMVYKERITPNGVQPTYDTWVPLMEQLKTDFPEVVNGTRYFNTNSTLVVDDVQYNDPITYLDPGFFEIFDFTIIKGNPSNLFPNNNSAVITESNAKKYFGNLDPIGKEISVDFEKSYVVSAIVEDTPQNSSIGLDVMILLTSHPQYARVEKNWGGSFLNTYIQTDGLNEQNDLELKFPDFIVKIWDEETAQRTNFKLLPLIESYETFVGDPKDSYILLSIAFGILLIAGINFVNLTTARSSERSQEIGMRKVLGSRKGQLFSQFMIESIFMSILSMFLGVVLAITISPIVNELVGIESSVIDPLNIGSIAILLGFALVLGFLSGLYPAVHLSGFSILPALKGDVKSTGRFRNVLVITQFALSILLIAGTFVILSQISFMKNADQGFDKSNLMVIPISSDDFEDQDEADVRLETFRNEINQFHSVVSTSTSTHIPTRWSGSNTFVRPEGWDGDPLRMRLTYHDTQFIDAYGIDLIQGPGFLPDSAGNQRESVILNEAAMDAFGFDQYTGNEAIMIGENRIDVVGVIKDFNFETLRNDVDPILHFHRIPANRVHNYITVKYNEDSQREVIDYISSKWGDLSSALPFQYFFIEDEIAGMYEAETRMFNMVSLFTGVSLFVACLGLFGLTSFMIEKRKKEIGIRKVLGARPSQIVGLLSSHFVKLVLISFVIAVPISIYMMNQWLEDFANAISIQPWVYAVALLLSGGIGILTLGFRSISAAYMDPVESIKDE